MKKRRVWPQKDVKEKLVKEVVPAFDGKVFERKDEETKNSCGGC